MAIFKGTTGKQLRIFLERKECIIEEVNQDVYEKYIGGIGYGTKILYDELEPGIDPLGPYNKLIFSTSPITLNKVPGGGSIILCYKSPLTNGWGDARCGCNFGPDLKKAGLDHVIIEGRSETPVYICINNGKVSFKPADHLLGKTVSEKTDQIRNDFEGKKVSVMCIGMAGENKVKFASVMSEGRAAGRTGAGAVMGSKNLIGIAVTGTNEIKPADPEKFIEACKRAFKVIKENPTSEGFRQFGTIGDMPDNDETGDFPTKNWQSNSWGKGAALFDYFQTNNFVKAFGCYTGCPVQCGRLAKVDRGKYKTPLHDGAEYETMSVFTAFVLNEDVDAAVHCSFLCNEFGVDTISCGAVIAFAMECYEKGLLKEDDVDGLDLTWGNAEVLPTLIKKIANREGIGNLLADGVKIASKKIGKGSEKFAIHVKGLEGPAHDPRSGKALAITYAVGNRGMCHIQPLESMAYDKGKMDWGMIKFGVEDPKGFEKWEEKGKGKNIKILQDGLKLPDILSTCKFMMYTGLTLDHWADMLSGLTGINIDGRKLLRIGERVTNLQRLFNMREGFTRKDDTLPTRVMNVPLFGKYKDEPDCAIKNLDAMLEEYYEARGWDKKDGIPKETKLKDLGII